MNDDFRVTGAGFLGGAKGCFDPSKKLQKNSEKTLVKIFTIWQCRREIHGLVDWKCLRFNSLGSP